MSIGRVLFVASECAPLVKTGGLADVVGALPLALKDWDVRVLLPAYPGLAERLAKPERIAELESLFGGPGGIIAGRVGGLSLLLLDAPHLFARKGSIYLGPDGQDWPDNSQRFAALSLAAAEIADGALHDGWRPGILHLHDWQAGLAAAYLHGQAGRAKLVMTVHNIAFQGLAPAHLLGELALPSALFSADGLEFYGKISALKAGLVYADAITTVSPTYATELLTPEFGMGLEGVISGRRAVLHGILNGTDTAEWDPAHDKALAATYSARDTVGKATCKAALEAEFGLTPGAGPLCAVVSRLTGQKGLDLLAEAMPGAVAEGARFVILGSGEAGLEAAFRALAKDHPGAVGVKIGYDEKLSHRIFGGADVILVPSRFEPCGLTQLYGLRYGTLPLVARTGGLADSVIDANDVALASGVATGFQFQPVNVPALSSALARVIALFREQVTWRKLMKNAMAQKVDWSASAEKYSALYRQLSA